MAVWIGYIALFGIAVETGVVVVIYLHEALENRVVRGTALNDAYVDKRRSTAVQRPAPKAGDDHRRDCQPRAILWESGIGSDVMKPIAAPIVGGMTVHVLILVPVFFLLMKRRQLHRVELQPAPEPMSRIPR